MKGIKFKIKNIFSTTSPEDMQAKYERIVLASLQGYTLYLQKLSSNQIQEAVNENNRLLSHPKFWKHAKSKVSVIRCSFYNCIISICQNAKFLLVGQSAHLNSAIFNNLDETDAIVLHSVWDAALHVLVSVEDCWLQVNIEKQLFTKLYKILKGGGRNVLTIYPNILPLLSKLPEDLIKDKDAFYRNLFDNMKCGLEVVSFNQSSSEGKILATTFIECFKFVIKQNSTNEEFCSSLLSNQLMPIFDKLLEGKVRETVKLPFLVETACLVHYWHANGSNKTSVYDQLINNFFLSLLSLFENQLNSEVTRNSITNVLDNQVQIINILLHPDQLKQNKKSHVKFKENIEPIEIQTLSTESHGFDVSECPNELTLFIKKLVGIYFKNAIDKVEKSYVVVLAKLLHLFDTEAIFEEMTRAVKESTTFKLFTSYFCKWLINEDMKCEEIVNLSFGLLRYVTYDEKEYILEELCNNWLDDSLRFSFCRVLPFYSHDNTIMNWVRSEKFLENLIDLVERFINGVAEYSKSRDVIIMLLKAKRTNEGKSLK